MAANKFATMLHKNTHKITAILIYAILEWILIILLLLNSLLSYLIIKFANYFGLKSPCLWCCRLDHIIEPWKTNNSYRDLICENHANEISELGYCCKHRKLAESHDMCDECCSSLPNSGHHHRHHHHSHKNSISWFSWVKEMDGENKLRCSCCDVSLLDTKFYSSPYVFIKPSWSVLDYAQKGGNLVTEEQIVGDCGESSDPCKSDSHTDHCEEDLCLQQHYEESFLRSTEFDENDSSMLVQGTDVPIHVTCKKDASLEILSLHSDHCYDFDHRLLPIDLIDSTTLEKQISTGLEHNVSSEEKQDEAVFDNWTSLEEEKTSRSIHMNIVGQCGISTVSSIEDYKRDSVAIPQATQTLSCNGDDVERTETPLVHDSDEIEAYNGPTYAAPTEENLRMSAEESTNNTQNHEPVLALLSCPHPNQSSSNLENEGVCTNSDADTYQNDRGPRQAETVDRLSLRLEPNEVEEERVPETPTYVDGLHHLLHKKSLSFERKESGTEDSLDGSVISEFDNGDGVLTVERLKSALKAEHKALTVLYAELEEERSASAVAANQTMAMITRLQEEKAAMQMEALQYQRMMEEQSEYDQEALQLMNELMVKREKEKQDLEKELEVYRKKVLNYEAKEKRKMRNRTSCERSRTSSISSSNVDSDELSVDLNHEPVEEDNFFGHHESSNQKTPADAVVNLENGGVESMKHLSTLDESLADFEDERQSILEQLKALEEKLFTLGDENDEVFEDIRPMEHLSEENGKEFPENYDFNSQDVNGFSGELGDKHYQERRNMGANAKRLLPLFDAIIIENGDDGLNEEHGSYPVSSRNSSVSKFTSNDEKLAIEEEVDHVYERLQALEADREFLKHCISSLKKGDKGMDLLQEILQHLRDLRSVELRVKNMGDHPTLS